MNKKRISSTTCWIAEANIIELEKVALKWSLKLTLIKVLLGNCEDKKPEQESKQ